jgi:plasmid stabilization system protein ParE
MKYRLVVRETARRNIFDAARYLAEQSGPETAIVWYHGIVTAIESLVSLPERCPHARENGLLEGFVLRQLFYKSHRIIFTIVDDEVHILHVRHVAQEPLREL